MRVLLIAPNYGHSVHIYPQNLAYLSAVLKQRGHLVDIYSQDLYGSPDKALTKYLDQIPYDMVGFGMCAGTTQYKRAKELSAVINKSKARDKFKFILGGQLFAEEPEYFLKLLKADHIYIGEAEIYIGYESTSHIVKCKPPDNLDKLPWPEYSLFPMWYYSLMGCIDKQPGDKLAYISSARGCSWGRCTFCFRQVPGYRVRDIDNVMCEIKYLQEKYAINRINFNEEELMVRGEEVCDAILRHGLKFRWQCDGRVNYAKPKLLKLMKRAGCVFINYGVESADNTILREMKKGITIEMAETAIKNTLKEGIHPGINIIWGFPSDTIKTLQKGVDFSLKYLDGSQMRTIRYVTPYPGSELYYYAKEKGLVKDVKDFYENKHINTDLMTVNMMKMSEESANKALHKANTQLINRYFTLNKNKVLQSSKDLYYNKNINFKGFR